MSDYDPKDGLLRPDRPVGIVGYGAYVPRYRLPATEVSRMWKGGTGGVPIEEKAVNGLDLALFRTAFGTTLGNPSFANFLDQNGDGAINGLDLAVFRTRFGTTMP